MAISHNLSTVNDNLSGFDPVAGESDGTTIGKSWLLWKLFEGLSAFDSNIVKITNASPTPTFLQSEAGTTLQTEPAKNRATTGDYLRFYMTNDPGLSQTPANAVVYEMNFTSPGTTNSVCSFKLRHIIDGSAVYAPSGDSDTLSGYSTTSGQLFYICNIYSTTTTMSNISKLVFWKSANANAVMGISKVDGTYQGGGIWYNPSISGYRHNVGVITNGVNARLTVINNPYGNGAGFIEPFTQTYQASPSALASGLSPLCSAGSMPTGLFTFSSINNLIAGKLRFGMKHDSQIKLVTDEIEGIILANTTAVNIGYGQIYSWNSKYYMQHSIISDGRESHRILLELGT
jgi:hypothetical protein